MGRLTLSYEAFLAMDCLRESANVTQQEMAAIMGISGSYYRYLRARVRRADEGSLNTNMDLKIRKYISYLIYGLLNSEHLPLMASHPDRKTQLNNWLTDAGNEILLAEWTPLGIHSLYTSSSLQHVIKIAERFAG